MGLNADDGTRRLLQSMCALSLQLLGEARHFDTLHPVISGFFIYYAVSYYIKSCLLSFCGFFFLLASHLLASGSFPHWQDNPEGILSGKLSSPPHLPKRTHTLGLRDSLGTSVYSFLWICSEASVRRRSRPQGFHK